MIHIVALVNRYFHINVNNSDRATEKESFGDYFLRPLLHATSQQWLYDYYKQNQERKCVIWMVSFLQFNGVYMPPSIDARLQVARIITRAEESTVSEYVKSVLKTYKYVFLASEAEGESFFLP